LNARILKLGAKIVKLRQKILALDIELAAEKENGAKLQTELDLVKAAKSLVEEELEEAQKDLEDLEKLNIDCKVKIHKAVRDLLDADIPGDVVVEED
jgi:predicted  nucleic acid-binding Zn-ribbon protein